MSNSSGRSNRPGGSIHDVRGPVDPASLETNDPTTLSSYHDPGSRNYEAVVVRSTGPGADATARPRPASRSDQGGVEGRSAGSHAVIIAEGHESACYLRAEHGNCDGVTPYAGATRASNPDVSYSRYEFLRR